eukprot:gene2885-3311_t
MAFEDLSDQSLIAECRTGNLKAFDQLFKKYFHRLYQYTLRHIDNPQLAEELVMDLMVWLWKKREEIEVKGDLSSYLFRAIKNSIYNHFRKTELATTSLDKVFIEAVASQTSEDSLAAKELGQRYQTSLAQLTPQRRKVFQLSREEDMTYPEIASHLNLSIKTVEAHVSASLQFLRKHFKDYADLILLVIVFHLFF